MASVIFITDIASKDKLRVFEFAARQFRKAPAGLDADMLLLESKGLYCGPIVTPPATYTGPWKYGYSFLLQCWEHKEEVVEENVVISTAESLRRLARHLVALYGFDELRVVGLDEPFANAESPA